MWQQGLDWLRGNALPYALVMGTIYFTAFWLIDHAASHLIAREVASADPSATPYRRNILGVLRRVFLLCATVVLMGLDYLPGLLLRLMNAISAQPQANITTALAMPAAALVAAVWLGIELWITRTLVADDVQLRQWWLARQLQRQRTGEELPGLRDWLQLPPEQKQLLLATPAYGRLSARINRALYALAYAHLVFWIYELRMG